LDQGDLGPDPGLDPENVLLVLLREVFDLGPEIVPDPDLDPENVLHEVDLGIMKKGGEVRRGDH